MTKRASRTGAIAVGGLIAGIAAAGLGAALLALLVGAVAPGGGCAPSPAAGSAASIVLGPPGTGARVGATEYGGPGDPSSGIVGASGANLLQDPDTYAELGGYTFQTATAMGGLPYMTPLRISWGERSAIAYKRDFGFGGGPIEGLPRVLDLWWEFAGRLGIPYENGLWSGPVRIERPPLDGRRERTRADELAARRIRRRRVRSGDRDRRLADARAARVAASEWTRGGAGERSGRRHGDRRRRQPDRWQAVRLRRRPWAGALGDRSVVRLLEQRLAPAVRGGVGARHIRRNVGYVHDLGPTRSRALGDDLRQRRARVHVRGRPALGHAQRGRGG